MAVDDVRTWQRATALVPLSLLSLAWTASLARSGDPAGDGTDARPGVTAAAPEPSVTGGGTGRLPDGTTVPIAPVAEPASLSAPVPATPVRNGSDDARGDRLVSGSSVTGIPGAALAAYQRSAQVIDHADRGCHLGWELLAAVGRVESDHGRSGGSTLSAGGVSTPGVYGVPLSGSRGTVRVTDTDGGRLDGDPDLDRAVGPMQLVPATWSVVGVDGDGDGTRDPQDIDDAALGAAVYLCSGEDDLATTAGARSAVLRYNHSRQYADLVLATMRAFQDGEFSPVPTSAAGATTIAPALDDAAATPRTRGGHRHSRAARPPARPGGSRPPGTPAAPVVGGGTGGSGDRDAGAGRPAPGGPRGTRGADGPGGTGGSGATGGRVPTPTTPAPTAPTGSGNDGGGGAATDPVAGAVKEVKDPVREGATDTADPVTDRVRDTTDPVTEKVKEATDPITGPGAAGTVTDGLGGG